MPMWWLITGLIIGLATAEMLYRLNPPKHEYGITDFLFDALFVFAFTFIWPVGTLMFFNDWKTFITTHVLKIKKPKKSKKKSKKVKK